MAYHVLTRFMLPIYSGLTNLLDKKAAFFSVKLIKIHERSQPFFFSNHAKNDLAQKLEPTNENAGILVYPWFVYGAVKQIVEHKKKQGQLHANHVGWISRTEQYIFCTFHYHKSFASLQKNKGNHIVWELKDVPSLLLLLDWNQMVWVLL